MQEWAKVAIAALSAAVVIIILIVFIWRFCYSRRLARITDTTKTKGLSFESKISNLQLGNDHYPDKGRSNFSVFRHGSVPKSAFFSWADHPWLVSEAVEYGWSRFSFTAYKSSPSTRSTLLGLCAAGDQGQEIEADLSWEVSQGSVDYMQKIRFNPGMKNIDMGIPPLGASCVIKSALPLPGPLLESNGSFPREAYLEITIMFSEEEVNSVHSVGESEMKKLIPQSVDEASAQSDSLIYVLGINGELKLKNNRGGGRGQDGPLMWSVGLSGGGSLPRKLPGSYPGSIGFNSNGSVFLDGMKLVFEAEKAERETKEKVIGCGFDPSQKKVFFTVDSELVHEIHCKSEEFGSPLYPTLAANVDVTVWVNFGQTAFKYSPANAQRTPNPCFICSLANGSAPALGNEDSREFFSMGRIDPQWLNQYCTKNNNNNNNGDNMSQDPDGESEAELFEIVLDSSNR